MRLLQLARLDSGVEVALSMSRNGSTCWKDEENFLFLEVDIAGLDGVIGRSE